MTNEALNKNVTDYIFFKSISEQIDLQYYDKKRKKEHLQKKHQRRKEQLNAKHFTELGKAAEISAFTALGLTVLAFITSFIDYSWHTLGDGLSSSLFFILGLVPTLFLTRYLYKQKTPVEGVVVISTLYVLIFAAWAFLLVRFVNIHLGTDVDVYYQLSSQNDQQQVWTASYNEYPDIDFPVYKPNKVTFDQLGEEQLLTIRKGFFGIFIISTQELDYLRDSNF